MLKKPLQACYFTLKINNLRDFWWAVQVLNLRPLPCERWVCGRIGTSLNAVFIGKTVL